jgi:hypothetical protein
MIPMIFTPLPRLVLPMSVPPPLAEDNGGIDKAFPLIYLSLLSAHWQGLSGHYEPLRFCTSVENDDELFCNSESSEAACATVLQYSVSKEQRPKPYV